MLDSDYDVDEERLEELVGVRLTEAEDWAGLTESQRAFAEALWRHAQAHEATPVRVEEIYEAVEERMGPAIWAERRASRFADVVHPLIDSGWIDLPEQTGRGGKSTLVAASTRLLNADIALLDKQCFAGVPGEILKALNTPGRAIRDDLASDDKRKKGLALEVLTVQIATQLGLTDLELRLRASQTGNAEVDLAAVSTSMDAGRWIVQCKNTGSSVGSKVVLREIGLAFIQHASVVLVVANSSFTSDAWAVADRANRRTATRVYLLERKALEKYLETGRISAIRNAIKRQAGRIRST